MFTLFSQAPVKPTPIQSQQASHESNPPLNDEAGYEKRPNPASTDAPGEPRFRYIGIAGGFVFTAFILGYLAPQLQIRSLRKQIQKLKEVQSRMAPQEALQSIKKDYEGRLGDLLKEMAKNKEKTSKLRDEIAGLREGLRRQADKLGSHQEEVDQKAAELEKRQRQIEGVVRASGTAFADVAAFMHETELGAGYQTEPHTDFKRIERIERMRNHALKMGKI